MTQLKGPIILRKKEKSNSLSELDSFLAYKQLKKTKFDKLLSTVKSLTLLSIAIGITISHFFMWDYIGFGIIMTSLWIISIGWLTYKKPQTIIKSWNIALGMLLLILPLIGILELYQKGSSGQIGEILIGNSIRLGIAQCLLLSMFSIYIMIPKKINFAFKKFINGIMWFHIKTLLITANFYRIVKLGAKKTLQLLRHIYIFLKNIIRFANETYPKFPLHRIITKPIKFFHSKINRHNSMQIQDINLESTTTSNVSSEITNNDETNKTSDLNKIQSSQSNESYFINKKEQDKEINSYLEETKYPLDGISQPSQNTKWKIPPLELLKVIPKRWVSEEENKETAKKIETAMKEYNIEVFVSEIRPGPVVTQYGLEPGWIRKYKDEKVLNSDGSYALDDHGKQVINKVENKERVKVSSVLAREDDLALTLAALSLRFEAPVPGENFIGLEVPNSEASIVNLRSILESSIFQKFKQTAELPVALGQGSGGDPIVADLTQMPHLLIAGATGSGKSMCMNTIICSLLMEKTPMDVRMYMIDPKRVELTPYEGLPHVSGPILVEVEDSVPTLKSILLEMDSRYKKFARVGAKKIVAYNEKFSDATERLPYILIIIDELADLMMTAQAEVESTLVRLAQLGRATGIHLIVATQRPSVDILTGTIKANFPSRISFAVPSQIDSRTILDAKGAEKLLGKGDMLYLPGNASKPKRLQGGFISDEEVQDIVIHWKQQHSSMPKLAIPISKIQLETSDKIALDSEAKEIDQDLAKAINLAKNHSRISAPLIQRKLGIGFTKASNLLSQLEDKGLVETGDPGKSRKVLIIEN